jgi:hypothetical protein
MDIKYAKIDNFLQMEITEVRTVETSLDELLKKQSVIMTAMLAIEEQFHINMGNYQAELDDIAIHIAEAGKLSIKTSAELALEAMPIEEILTEEILKP